MIALHAIRRLSRITAVVGLLSLFVSPAWAENSRPPKYSADVPSWITTPDTVKTSIGTLRFHEGAPDKKTVKMLYDELDFSRGIEAFLTGMPATSVYALCNGFSQAGVKLNHGIGITENLMDAQSLFLTANTTIVYVFFCVDFKHGPMVVQVPAYAITVRDSHGNYLDGGKTYKVTLPDPIPAKSFWALTVYDNQTRSLLETDQKLAGVDSNEPGIRKNADDSVTIWFGPRAPAGHETNWVQTVPNKGYNVALRLYAPLEPWFNKSWKPGDLEPVD